MKIVLPALLSIYIAIVTGQFQANAQNNSPAEQAFHSGVAAEKTNPASGFAFYLRAASLAERENPNLYFDAVANATKLAADLKGDYWQRALPTLRHSVQLLHGKYATDLRAANLFYYCGRWLSDPDSAALCFEKSLELRKRLLGNPSEKIAECYHELGDICKYTLYDFDKAEDYYEKALEIREKIIPRDQFQLSRTYYNLATTNRSQRDFEKALSYGFRALALAERLKVSEQIERTYSILGNIYRDMGRYDSARRMYESAIELVRINHDASQIELLADLYQGLGEVQKMQGRYDDALPNYHCALDIFATIRVLEPNMLLHCLHQTGEIYAIKNMDDRALVLYRKSWQAHTNMNLQKSGSASALCKSIGDLFMKEGNLDSALHYYQKSLICAVRGFNSVDFNDNPAADSVEMTGFVYESLVSKAEVLDRFFDKTREGRYSRTALDSYLLAEKVLLKARNSLDMEDAKWAFLDSNFGLYEKSIDLIYKLYQYSHHDSLQAAAYHYFEAGKSRSLADAVQLAEKSNPVVQADTLLRSRRQLSEELLRLQDQLKKSNDNARIQSIRNLMVDLDRKMKGNEDAIRGKYPSYFDVKYEYKVPHVSDVQEFANRSNALVLEYFWGIRSVYAICITGEKVSFLRLGSVDSIAAPIRQLLTSFEPGRSGLDLGSFQSFSTSAFDLYQLLVAPFVDETSLPDRADTDRGGKRRIVVVPDGFIGLIPFEALIKRPANSVVVNYKDLDYLIKGHRISYSYSAALRLNQRGKPIANPSMLGFGLTGFGEKSTESGGVVELASLAKRFPSGEFYSNNRATREDFKRSAPNFDLIHLAVHGRGDPEGDHSASLFFENPGDSLHPEELHWYELYSMKLKAVLTVLSSCESGLGKSYRGEGMLSMSNAFMYSGCRNIVMGLWKVNDQQTVQLMEKFYDGLLVGETMDEALENAKLDYLKNADEFTAHPKFWGALVAYGDQQVIKDEKGNWILISSALLFLFLVMIILLRQRIIKALNRQA